jgi:hypothetical protein
LYPLLHNGEGEETMNDSKKMVVAACANAGARLKKIVNHEAIDCLPPRAVAALDVVFPY